MCFRLVGLMYAVQAAGRLMQEGRSLEVYSVGKLEISIPGLLLRNLI